MDLLRKIILPKNLIYILFIFLHLVLLNINAAEWGDSYRILRASEFLRSDFDYPLDEKRPPLYSLLLAIRPEFVDPIVWGRVFMLIVSIVFLLLFEKFLRLFIKNDKYINLGLILLALNPVFLYWSLRIYADVFFSLFVLLAVYLVISFLKIYSNKIPLIKFVFFGIIAGLAILTRFEGYLLFGSLGLMTLFWPISSKSFDLFLYIKQNFLKIFTYVFSTLVVILPWFIYRNPFVSTYLEEPAGRKYDFQMLWIYIASLIFIFGFTSGFSFILLGYKKVLTFLKSNLIILFFGIFDLILILLWPAAIPRLFVPLIPFFVLFLVISIQEFFENDFSKKLENKLIIFQIGLLGFYIVCQYFLKLQFLIPTRSIFIGIVLIQLSCIVFLKFKQYKLYFISIFVSCLLWSGAILFIHKDNYISVKNGAEFISKNLEGRIAYNDVSSVSDWYLNVNPHKNSNVTGYYYNFEKDKLLTLKSLSQQPLDYLLITNEHNTTMEIDLSKRPYLTLIKEFSYNVNGKQFSTRVVKLERQ